MRPELRALLGSPSADIAARAAATLLDRLPRPEDALVVLTYHRVDEPGRRPDLDPGLLSATPRQFERHVREIARRYRPVGLAEVLAARRSGRALPERAVLVTFDDAYTDFRDVAWPVLRRHRVPAVLFVATGFATSPTPFWWDALHAALQQAHPAALRTLARSVAGAAGLGRPALQRHLRRQVKRLPHDAAMALVGEWLETLAAPPAQPAVLGWPDLRSLAAEGVTIAAHTRNHPILTNLDDVRAASEVLGAVSDVRAHIDPAAPLVLAYPSGAHDARSVDLLERLGFELAFTTRRGANRIASQPRWLAMRRMNVGRWAGAGAVALQLHPAVAAAVARLDGPSGEAQYTSRPVGGRR